MRHATMVTALVSLLGAGGIVQAQTGRSPDSMRPLARGRRGGQAPAGAQALRREVRQRFAEVVRRQLALTDDQAQRLQQTDTKYQRQRQEIQRDERDARQGLRRMLADTAGTPDATKVDQYISRLVQAQRKRADLLEAEQKDLAGFLNPVQRAKFMALREQLNQRITELNRQGGGRRGGPPGPPPL